MKTFKQFLNEVEFNSKPAWKNGMFAPPKTPQFAPPKTPQNDDKAYIKFDNINYYNQKVVFPLLEGKIFQVKNNSANFAIILGHGLSPTFFKSSIINNVIIDKWDDLKQMWETHIPHYHMSNETDVYLQKYVLNSICHSITEKNNITWLELVKDYRNNL